MDKKQLITILIDIVLLAIIVLSVYYILVRHDIEWINNLSTGVIVVCIPTTFYITYMTFAYDKFEYNEQEFEDIEEENGEESNEKM